MDRPGTSPALPSWLRFKIVGYSWLQLPIIDASGSISETVDAVLGTIG